MYTLEQVREFWKKHVSKEDARDLKVAVTVSRKGTIIASKPLVGESFGKQDEVSHVPWKIYHARWS